MSYSNFMDYYSDFLNEKKPETVPFIKFEESGINYWELNQLLILKEERKAYNILEKLRNKISQVYKLEKNATNDITVNIIKKFLNVNNLLKIHHNELMEKYGECTFNQLNDIFKYVQEFKDNISEQCLNIIKNDHTTPLDNAKTFINKIPKQYLPNKQILNNLQNLKPRTPKLKMPDTIVGNTTNSKMSHIWTGLNMTTKSDLVNLLKQYNVTCYEDEDFCTAILDIVRENINKNFKNKLYDYLGLKNEELYLFIAKNKEKILQIINTSSANKLPNGNVTRDKEKEMPSYGVQVTVQSKKEKQLQKTIKKLEKKKLREEVTYLEEQQGFNNLIEEKQLEYSGLKNAPLFPIKKILKQAPVVYPNVYDSRLNRTFNKISYADGKKVEYEYWDKIVVPPISRENLPKISEPVKIKDLDEIGQKIFQGITELNVIQSAVFAVAYSTNENMLISAPTGAGKTNTALLTVAQQIRQHLASHSDFTEFKMVYVVPMKALAAEITDNFKKKLKPVGLEVRELTGDMQLTPKEIQETQVLVTTPEKWDVVTRKGFGDNGIVEHLKLVIIDEIHLLHGDRGPVIEALVARTKRLVEATQSMIRIVGLSATLPNYVDIARFLGVNLNVGLFYFDSRFRPVPLTQVFIGIKPMSSYQVDFQMRISCYEQVLGFVRQGHQCMVFVHSRKETNTTATGFQTMSVNRGESKMFIPTKDSKSVKAFNHFSKADDKHLISLASNGFSIHHAGMTRHDRNIVEKYFREGVIKVLVCTATLAWGVNLPAHGVIIMGTKIYNAQQGAYVPLDVLDVIQIFGRAGRPQFDTSGTGVIITTHEMMSHYRKLLTLQTPIESSFQKHLSDHLNAEIVLGNVTNITEAVKWLSYTYFYQRIRQNPLVYGVDYMTLQEDPTLQNRQRELLTVAAQHLDKAKMIRFDHTSEEFVSTQLGRTASFFYISYDTVERINEKLNNLLTEKDIFNMLCHAQEFDQVQSRGDEEDELVSLKLNYCEIPVSDDGASSQGKVNILMQTFLSRGSINSFSMISDLHYVTQNVVRLARGLFEMVLYQDNACLANICLMVAKMFEQQQWNFQTPFRQFNTLKHEIIDRIEKYHISIEDVRQEYFSSLTHYFKNETNVKAVKKCAFEFPYLNIDSNIQPITRSVLRVHISIEPVFHWNDKVHNASGEHFWLWIVNPENNVIYYSEKFQIRKINIIKNELIELVFTVPLMEQVPSQYIAQITSDKWLQCTYTHVLSFRDLILPASYSPHTDLLPLTPLPVTIFKNKSYENLYSFQNMNPIQTQVFHCLYHTDNNTLIGAPTGSGKTIMAEFAILRSFRCYPEQKVVYIAPLKALVRERVNDWKKRFEQHLRKPVLELTGDVNPNQSQIEKAAIIITTPEKWDGLSRNWAARKYVKKVGLIVIDEIHLLGEDRGPVLEVIVSRYNYISTHTSKNTRIVGLSTAMANAKDLADWLNIDELGLYNFRPSVRPVPLEVHISGYPGKHYCPRMISMNKPTYLAIKTHAYDSPALVFVSSRRQTKLTAVDLISYLSADTYSKQWLHISEEEMSKIVSRIKDNNLKFCLPFGIGLHHAGLEEGDRKIVEELFGSQKIQVMIATSTLAWGVNFPAHLVVVKGTEYFDPKKHQYVDMPITDVLQMMGRAGRPQFDNVGVAVVLVHDIKKNFYKKFLYEPFPIESNLMSVLPDHLNAEIASGMIKSTENLKEYLKSTFFYRRLLQNPSYYNLPSVESEIVNNYLEELCDSVFQKLMSVQCIEYNEERNIFISTQLGSIASTYYISIETISYFYNIIQRESDYENLLKILCGAKEFSEIPVRHNEEYINEEMAAECRMSCINYDKPETKAFLLLQAHLSRLSMPIQDYYSDLKQVLDQTIRVIQAMIDVTTIQQWLDCTIKCQQILQMLVQACWLDKEIIQTLYDFKANDLKQILSNWDSVFKDTCDPDVLPHLMNVCKANTDQFCKKLQTLCGDKCANAIVRRLLDLPTIKMSYSIIKGGTDIIRENNNNKLPIKLKTRQQYEIAITLKRKCSRKSVAVLTDKFPKTKDEMWFINVGYRDLKTLVAMKRITIYDTSECKLKFSTPDRPGKYTLTVFLVSDSYIGLDQQYDIYVDVSDNNEEQ